MYSKSNISSYQKIHSIHCINLVSLFGNTLNLVCTLNQIFQVIIRLTLNNVLESYIFSLFVNRYNKIKMIEYTFTLLWVTLFCIKNTTYVNINTYLVFLNTECILW